MGTRADFYVGRGLQAKWLGSIAWDGYPKGIAVEVLDCSSETAFRLRVHEFFDSRDDATLPEHGWPWPWEDSRTTDYAYAFDDGKVHASNFGGPWFDPLKPQPEQDERKVAVFPDMAAQQKVTFGKRSGLIIAQTRIKK